MSAYLFTYPLWLQVLGFWAFTVKAWDSALGWGTDSASEVVRPK